MSRLKQKLWRDKKYGKWISENLNCTITEAPNPDPHHIKNYGYGSIKAPDHMQMAISHKLHNELHDIGVAAFEKKYNVTQEAMLAETILAAHAKGRININELDIPGWLNEAMEEFE